MIPKITSKELNDILENANQKLTKVDNDIKTIKNDISTKLKIMRYEAEYIETGIKKLNDKLNNTESPVYDGDVLKTFSVFEKKYGNNFESFGTSNTARFKNRPVNLFNIISNSTGEAFYRDVAEVAVNGVINDDFKSILMHDSLKKELFFKELSEDTIDISIKMDMSKTLGSSMFNMIEFDTFLSGSYTIESIKIYDSSNYTEYVEYTDFNNAGKMRINLDSEYTLYKVDIRIKSNYSSQIEGTNKYAFGIKHIYFYNAKFSTDSNAVAVVRSTQYIDTISNNITIVTPNERVETTIENEGIKLYLNHNYEQDTDSHIFTTEQEASTNNDAKPISMNVKEIYAVVPLKEKTVLGIIFETSSKAL